MEFELPALRRDERLTLRLRALYEQRAYRLFRVGSFETYDFYMQNRPFLTADDIITFTGADGRLLALKPDVTLSIVKNTPPGEARRVYYTENVFRRSRASGEYREISQMGLEYIGGPGRQAESEVLDLALQSLDAVGAAALDLSHMGVIEAVLAVFEDSEAREAARRALRDKSPHGMRAAAEAAALSDADTRRLVAFAQISGPFAPQLAEARRVVGGLPGVGAMLDELQALYDGLPAAQTELRLDFSILNDADYYNGLVFKGFVQGVPHSVLSGGRYDNLLHRFDKPQGAVGFALYLDEIDGAAPASAPGGANGLLHVALPKGRLGDAVYALFERAGFGCDAMRAPGRKLVFEDAANGVCYYLVKPSDVHSYVEHGVADIGVVGKDVLLESGADVLELLDLGLGKCRVAVAGPAGFAEDPARVLRVATKYPQIARRHYAAQSRAVEIIELHGSIELAPITGLSDVIVDIVETGSTLVENNLAVLADVVPSSARLIAGRAAWRFKQDTIQRLAGQLAGML